MTTGSRPGPEGTTAQWYVFAEFLRRSLHAAADQVEPQADGLEPIRAKIMAGAGVPWPEAFSLSPYWDP